MLYIRLKEWDRESFKIAYKEAERLWYKPYHSIYIMYHKKATILILNAEYYLISFYSETELIQKWYKHHKINPLRKLYYYLTK